MDDTLTVFTASKYCNVSPKPSSTGWMTATSNPIGPLAATGALKRDDLEAFMRKQGIPIPEEKEDGRQEENPGG
jgi:hypothetical protein